MLSPDPQGERFYERELDRELAPGRRGRMLRELVDHIREVFWITTPDKSRMLFISRGYEEVWGQPRAQLYERSTAWIDAIHPDDRDRVRAALPAQVHGDYDVEYRIVRPDGGVRWIWDRAFPVRNERGKVERIVGIAEDVTEHKQAEETRRRLERSRAAHVAAEAAERRARFLAEVGATLASSLDYAQMLSRVAALVVEEIADYCVVDVVADHGPALERVAVASRDPELRRSIEAVTTAPPGPDSPAATALRIGRPLLVEDIDESWLERIARSPAHRKLLDTIRPTSLIAVPLVARERSLGAITLATEDRRFGEEDLTLAVELARRAAIAVDNARLYEDALAASRAKSEFLAVMSHELRTPLTAVLGYAEILESGIRGPVTEAQRADLERIKASTRQLVDSIEEILTFSRLERGRQDMRIESVDLTALAREAARIIEPLAREKGLRLRVDIPDRPVPAETDPAMTRRILHNLLTNAVKFTAEGTVSLAMTASDAEAVFQVRDTGIGIAPEDLDRIFTPFWQADATLTREVGGTGLGLAVARRSAHALGGGITVRSEVGKGSTFTVTLPLRAPTTGDDAA